MPEVIQEGSKAILKAGQDIVESSVSDLKQRLRDIVSAGVTELVIDLTGVEIVDSTGVGLLLSTHNSLSKAGGKLLIVNVSKDIFDLFKNMRLDQHFSVVSA